VHRLPGTSRYVCRTDGPRNITVSGLVAGAMSLCAVINTLFRLPPASVRRGVYHTVENAASRVRQGASGSVVRSVVKWPRFGVGFTVNVYAASFDPLAYAKLEVNFGSRSERVYVTWVVDRSEPLTAAEFVT
jgi:hypothetical protein